MLPILQGLRLLRQFKWSMSAAVADAFPELVESLGYSPTEKYRDVLCAFAQDKGFDPLKPENWTKVTKDQIREKKVRLLAPLISPTA